MKIYINSSYKLFSVVSIFTWGVYLLVFSCIVIFSGLPGIMLLPFTILFCTSILPFDSWVTYVFLRKYFICKSGVQEIVILRKNSEIPLKRYNIKKIKSVLLQVSDFHIRIGIDSKEHGQDTYIVAIKIYYGKFFHKKTLTKIMQDMKDIFGDKLEITS